jgi:uncharacterized coiled-coil protein SlyX
MGKKAILVLWRAETFNEEVDKAAGNTLIFHCPKIDVIAEGEIDEKIVKEVKADPRLTSLIIEAAAPHYKELVQLFAGALKDLNAGVISGKTPLDQADEAFKKAFDSKVLGKSVEKAIQKMSEAAGTKVAKHFADTTAYRNYQIILTCKIVLAGSGVVVSVALIASSPWTAGAGAVIGIIGLAKSSIQLVSMIKDALADVDDEIKKAYKVWDSLQAEAAKSSGAEFAKKTQDFFKDRKKWKKEIGKDVHTSKEVINELANAIIGLKPFGKTLKEAKTHLNLAETKLKGVEVAVTKLSKKVPRVLQKIDALQAELLISKSEPTKNDKINEKKLEELETKLKTLNEGIDKYNAYQKAHQEFIDQLQTKLDLVEKHFGGKREVAVEALELALKGWDLALAIATVDPSGMAFSLAGLAVDGAEYLLDKKVTKDFDKTVKQFTDNIK